MPAELPTYRIFIASPGDVPEERARARRVVERLGGEFADQLHLSSIAWEGGTYGAHADFQSQIADIRDCHLVVGILWQRVGTPLDGRQYPREDGTPFESGTVFEIETALNLRRRGTPPDVALFKKRAPPQQALSPEDARQLAVELPLLEVITRRWFRTDSGAFKAAFNDFTTPEGFEALLEQHLRGWLAERGHTAEGRVWRIETDGSPYPGLSPYDAPQARVFFGRARARLSARLALTEAAKRGCPFLLIVGGSGAGKSSLARAGLLPSLALPGTAPGVDGWRVATLRPGAAPLAALAEAIFTALPAMAEGEDATPGAWAATLQHLPERAPRAVEKALARAGAATGQSLRLLLLADQLEEAFDAPMEQRQAFGAALAALVRAGQWVVATLRADRYPALLEQPDLLALQAEGATQNLVPPDAEDIAAIIRDPARAAGLQFERDATGRDLAQLLRDDMDGADALPLLQMALARLFVERDAGANCLTFAAYAAMGGLRGAIQARADAVFAEADAAAQAELPAVLLALTAGLSEAGLAIARPVAEAELATSPARRALLRVLVEGRLLVSERTATGAVQLRVAHEALLRNWPQAAQILAPEHLRAKPRLEAALADWQERGAKARDLLRGTLLDAGLGLLRAHAAALPPPLADYITRSRRADQLRRFGALGVAGGVAAVFGVLALLAWGFAREAEQQAVAAEAAHVEAVREAARANAAQAIAAAAREVAEAQRSQAEAEAARAEREAAAAEAARARAEIGFAAARDAASSLVYQLAAELRNRQGMPAGLVRDLLDRAGRALDTLLARTPDDPATLQLRGAAYLEFATTFAALGDTARERQAAEQALRLFLRLTTADPGSTVSQRRLAESHERLGDALRAQGEGAAALTAYRAAAAIRERFAAANPADARWWRDLAISHTSIGGVLYEQGDRTGALLAFQAGLAVRERLLVNDPMNRALQRDLSIAHERIGDLLRDQRDRPRALAAYRAAIALREPLALADPENTRLQRELAGLRASMGAALFFQGDRPEALAAYREAMAITERLARSDPGNSQWQRDLSANHMRIADVLREQGNYAEALAEHAAALQILGRVAAANPSNVDWQRRLAGGHERMAVTLLAQGDTAGALAAFGSFIAISERLAAHDPGNPQLGRDLAVGQLSIGHVLSARGDGAGALAAYRSGVEMLERLLATDAGHVGWLRDLAYARKRMGDVLLAQGDGAGALAAYQADLAIRERLAGQDPSNFEWQRDMFTARWRLGDTLLRLGQPTEARAYGRSAAALVVAMRLRFPDQQQGTSDLAAAEDLLRRIEAATP